MGSQTKRQIMPKSSRHQISQVRNNQQYLVIWYTILESYHSQVHTFFTTSSDADGLKFEAYPCQIISNVYCLGSDVNIDNTQACFLNGNQSSNVLSSIVLKSPYTEMNQTAELGPMVL